MSADYPYYRDDPAVWADRLRSLRDELGIEVVSAYVPWRHHQPDPGRVPDFTGAEDPARDVVGFLRHCHRLGLGVILKPGPFIHAETNYGGLPDWVRPGPDNGIEAVLDAAQVPAVWSGARLAAGGAAEQWPLPAPLDPRFLALTRCWLNAVGAEVVRPHRYPHGPVRLVQIANEGLYTNGAQPLWAFDYSDSALDFFRAGLRRWYGDLDSFNQANRTAHTAWSQVEPPRGWSAPQDVHSLCRYVDWGRFHAEYLEEVYRLWSEALDPGVPVVVNLNPPAGEPHAIDAWLARVRPARWQRVHYGFTNWMGVVSSDPGAHARYVIAAKRAPGPNLEENWGFSELYDRAYADAATSFHQTLLAMACGATGFNVYTGAATQRWTEALDVLHQAPYPDSAPVDAAGRPTDKAPVVRLLANFFDTYGAEFLECVPVIEDAWAVYGPYASVAAWVPTAPAQLAFGQRLRAYHDHMRTVGRDYALVDLETADAAELRRYRTITLHSGQFLDRRAQQALAEYVRAGGRLRLSGQPPHLDEYLRPCRILADAWPSGVRPGPDTAPGVLRLSGRADVYLRTHPGRDVSYLVVLVASDNGQVPVQLRVDDGRRVLDVAVNAADGGAAVLRVLDGRLDACLVKGVNGYLGSTVRPSCAVGADLVLSDRPGDLGRIAGTLRILGPAAEPERTGVTA